MLLEVKIQQIPSPKSKVDSGLIVVNDSNI